jgi:uncharacterized membrane protein
MRTNTIKKLKKKNNLKEFILSIIFFNLFLLGMITFVITVVKIIPGGKGIVCQITDAIPWWICLLSTFIFFGRSKRLV